MVFSFEVAPRRAHKFLQGLVPRHALLSLQQNVLRQKKSALAGRRCCGWKAEPKVKRMAMRQKADYSEQLCGAFKHGKRTRRRSVAAPVRVVNLGFHTAMS
jgi:hypothetical protein